MTLKNNHIFTNSELKGSLNYIMEVNDTESDVADLTNRLDDLSDKVDNLSEILTDDVGRMSYVRQLTAEFLEYLKTLNDESVGQIDIPLSDELMGKMLGRTERKRYYMSKFRL